MGQQLGEGGEGHVFVLEEVPKLAVKLIDESRKSPEELRKIRRQIQALLDVRNKDEKSEGDPMPLRKFLTLPRCLIDDGLGYVMVNAVGFESLSNFLHFPDEMEKQEEWLNTYDLVRRYKAINYIFERLERIHLAGLVFSDLSPNNILVKKEQDSSVVFIDTDNMRTPDNRFSNILGTPGYMAPELYGEDPKEADAVLTGREKEALKGYLFSPQTDVYSAAVIAFELLTLAHPYKGIKAMGPDSTPEDEQDAEKGKFDYILKLGTDNYCEGNIYIDKFDDITTPEIRELFSRTFVEGKENPLLRPTAKEFNEAFQKASRLIVKCPCCGEETLYLMESDRARHPAFHSVTTCINPDCAKPIEGQYVLSFLACPYKRSASSVLLGDEIEDMGPFDVVLSQIILPVDKPIRIYANDLGLFGNRTSDYRFAQVGLGTDRKTLTFTLEKIGLELLEAENIQIVCLDSKKATPISSIGTFNYESHWICIKKLKTKYGEMAVLGVVRKI